MLQWLPYELHTHTFHSDGEHLLLELARSAKELGLFGIAMTDHNTMSPLLERKRIQEETRLHIVRGMEWTTFYGHMLAVGIGEYADWRQLGIEDIHQGIERVHRQGGIVGIAHPFRMGSPLCTGCYWEYDITDWHDIDYIEVWSGIFPSIMSSNQTAFRLWTDKLNEGYRIAGLCGRDWHVSSKKESEPIAVAYLGLAHGDIAVAGEFAMEQTVVDAIRGGAVSVTMGPLLDCTVWHEPTRRVYRIGEEISLHEESEAGLIQVEVDFSARKEHWQLDDQELKVRLTSNAGLLGELTVTRDRPSATVAVKLDGLIWLRAELYGALSGIRTMIAFTNPIYVRQPSLLSDGREEE
ncbi:PHP domain-containing protein [Paenibacillus hemerocallicola]|uniref:PHP domain-containing protein n=1 Tax=Paenibacillus hemerocallicola TaxID=1172614 RepID=A0A5C4TFA5_9BACL|nr:CehA/McbA family metallohydrolase [Paenibacillus hemerocallicola]TNJ67721.1 PHP domain-containing protein [Paenibacillus hemerocallicola]